MGSFSDGDGTIVRATSTDDSYDKNISAMMSSESRNKISSRSAYDPELHQILGFRSPIDD